MKHEHSGRYFANDTFICIFVNEKYRILNKISSKFAPDIPIDKMTSPVVTMAWHRRGDKSLPQSMMTQFTDAHMNVSVDSGTKGCLYIILTGIMTSNNTALESMECAYTADHGRGIFSITDGSWNFCKAGTFLHMLGNAEHFSLPVENNYPV